ncbi:MAG: response regulator [Burkholderiaceae bacterium]
MAERILIVEDEDRIAEVLRDYLVSNGYDTHRLARGDLVEDWVRREGADLVLLDLMLPGRNGLEICKALKSFSDTAIIIITARVEEIDRLLGLELGADDYICKPFSPREVVARVKAVLRRTRGSAAGGAGGTGAATAEGGGAGGSPGSSPGGGLTLDEAGWRALIDGRDLALTAVEFQLLKVLSGQPGRIFTREKLMDAMYNDERIVADRTVDSHIKKLRRKIADAAPGRELIHSVYGVGYKFEPD